MRARALPLETFLGPLRVGFFAAALINKVSKSCRTDRGDAYEVVNHRWNMLEIISLCNLIKYDKKAFFLFVCTTYFRDLFCGENWVRRIKD